MLVHRIAMFRNTAICDDVVCKCFMYIFFFVFVSRERRGGDGSEVVIECVYLGGM